MRAAGRALAAGKPIIAIKTGATQKSRAAAQSHTGAIGGDYAAYLAMCERYGIVNCRSLDDMVETALAFQGGRLPKGPRIGFVTTSGGTVDLLYDYAEAEGAVMPEFQRRHQRRAAAVHAGRHRAEEPARPRHSDDAASTPPTCARWWRAIRTSTWSPGPRMLPGKGGALGRRRRTAAALLARDRQADHRLRPHDLSDDAGRRSPCRRQAGFPFLQGLEPTLRALNALWFYAQRAGPRAGRRCRPRRRAI